MRDSSKRSHTRFVRVEIERLAPHGLGITWVVQARINETNDNQGDVDSWQRRVTVPRDVICFAVRQSSRGILLAKRLTEPVHKRRHSSQWYPQRQSADGEGIPR